MNKLGLIAGNGVFPLEVARAARERGIKIVAVAHLNESDRALDSVIDEVTWIKVGELQKIVDVFKNAGVEEAAMAGGISRARLKDSFAPDARALKMLAGIGRFSDDAVLRGVAREVEAENIKMIDPVPMICALARARRRRRRSRTDSRATPRSRSRIRGCAPARQLRHRPDGRGSRRNGGGGRGA